MHAESPAKTRIETAQQNPARPPSQPNAAGWRTGGRNGNHRGAAPTARRRSLPHNNKNFSEIMQNIDFCVIIDERITYIYFQYSWLFTIAFLRPCQSRTRRPQRAADGRRGRTPEPVTKHPSRPRGAPQAACRCPSAGPTCHTPEAAGCCACYDPDSRRRGGEPQQKLLARRSANRRLGFVMGLLLSARSCRRWRSTRRRLAPGSRVNPRALHAGEPNGGEIVPS